MAKSRWPEIKEKLMLVAAWCRDGLTDKQIAERLDISQETFYVYKREHTEFSEALKNNKEYIDTEVENALLKRARGYTYEEITTEIEESALGERRKVKKVKKEVAPDVTAQIIWLKNRRPDLWRDRQEPTATAESLKRLDDILEGVNRVMAND